MRERYLRFCVLFWLLTVGTASAQSPREAALAETVQDILVSKIPLEHEEKQNWGKTVRVFDGWKAQGKGLNVRISKRKKEVPHGLWKRFRIWVDDPSRSLTVDLRNAERIGADRVRFQLSTTVRGHGLAEIKQYSNGLQLLGITSLADGTVELLLTCEVLIGAESGLLLPTLTLAPRIVESKLYLQDFQLRRVGPVIRGKVAEELGEELRGEIQRLLRKQEHKVAEEANKAIAKSLKGGKLYLRPDKLLDFASDSRR